MPDMPSMTLLQTITRARTNDITYSSIAIAVEKIAADIAREILADPEFRAQLKTLTQTSALTAVQSLKTSKPRRRKAVTK